MAPIIYPAYPPALTPEQSAHLVTEVKDWSIAHGLAVRPPSTTIPPDADPGGALAITAPVSLFPSLFPRSCLEKARQIQKAYNELYAAIARDEEWLGHIVEDIIQVDDFIAQLWVIHLTVKNDGYVQDLSLGIFRSDYMVHVDPADPSSRPSVKQVEFNTIAASFGGLSAKVSEMHRHLLATSAYPPTPLLATSSLPPNSSITSLASGLATAHHAYGASKSKPSLPLCILFVVQSPERNIFDQRPLEYSLNSAPHQIPTFRLPFSDVLDHTSIRPDHPSRPLIYTPPSSPDAPHEVSLVYFRAGYAPHEYVSKESWTARGHLERSAAIKCPSILTHLAGSKKVQQVLATPSSSHLSRFLPDPDVAEAVRETFAPIYPLDDTSPAGREARAIALDPQKSQDYVLKPQREGGGNNIYRSAIPGFLASIPEARWKGYILMKLIEPPALENMLLRNGVVEQGGVIGELGVYGTVLWRNGKKGERGEVLSNEEAGYLLRTKGRESEEGGVAAGFGAVDSCLLIDV
ncbi:MAG: hypothetical protein M1817_006389 [Caeruleum heppii]|nr:MAG: hypothetical protein M1817_006389 [Caeruleum heppii]